MMDIYAAHNQDIGIGLYSCTDTTIVNICAAHNQKSGILVEDCVNTSMYYTATHNNNDDGMHMNGCKKTYILYLSSTHNANHGISLLSNCFEILIMNSVLNDNSGIYMIDADNICVSNTTSIITALNDTTFSNMRSLSTASSSSNPTSLPAVITLYGSYQ